MRRDDHDGGLALADTLREERRDATEAELVDEPELVVHALALGELGATETTRERARRELGRRHLDRARAIARDEKRSSSAARGVSR